MELKKIVAVVQGNFIAEGYDAGSVMSIVTEETINDFVSEAETIDELREGVMEYVEAVKAEFVTEGEKID